MATDPVQQIQEMEHDTPLAMDLTATLARLAATAIDRGAVPDGQPRLAAGRFSARSFPGARAKAIQRRAPREEDGAPRRPAWQQLRRDLGDGQ